jgi:anionic cell wall polymer biosynthesis LytR-Cps2A-Psr (LCP) family protein
MNAGNQLEKEIRELKLLVKGLSKVNDFPHELLELMDNHIDNISQLVCILSDETKSDINTEDLKSETTIQSVSLNPPTVIMDECHTEDKQSEKVVVSPSQNNPKILFNDSKPVQTILNDTIETKRIVDLNRMMTLNDRFRFQREFFSNDSSRMNECLSIINGLETIDEAIEYFKSNYPESVKSDDYDEFVDMLGRMFLKSRS